MADEHRQDRPQTDRQWQRWNDDRLDQLEQTVRLLGSTVTTVAVHTNQLEDAADDRDDIRLYIHDVEARLLARVDAVQAECVGFRAEYRTDHTAAKASTRTLVIAVIAASATVIAAIIGGAVTILTSGGTP